jgi:hypothetical protein
MKKLSFLFIMAVLSMPLKSQSSITTLKFADIQHDFRVFNEDAGRQTFDFIVTNTGDKPLIIQKVEASRPGTSPEWTKSPILPGEKGKVTGVWDPASRLGVGVFNKMLIVYTNTLPATTTLIIKGEVIAHVKTDEELLTFPVGGVGFESNQLVFPTMKKTETKEKYMLIINTSPSAVKVEFDELPSHLKLITEPEILEPGQKGQIIGTYDATKNPGWGNINELIKIKLNGVPQENVYYWVRANLVEDFSTLSNEELANAPVFKLVSNTYDLGKIKGSSQKEVEFKFINEGKRDLIIRHITSSCGCTAIQQGNQGVGIKPGEASSIKAIFNSTGYKGKVTKAIYVYTNDPKNSEAILMFNADVEQSGAMK